MNTSQMMNELLVGLASAIRGERRARDEKYSFDSQAEWREAVSDRLEALALYALHGIEPSTYIDTRDRQVQRVNLAPIFRAGGTY
jgi:hypothetical protein